MVERPADVLQMDPARPVRQSGFGRLDMALRKTPGLGIFIVLMLLDHLTKSGNGIALLGFSVMVAWALAEEFCPGIVRRFTSTPAPERPSQPSA